MIINNTVDEFINSINNGKVVCFKTDTIWGFSADATNKKAIQNLYRIKQRDLDKPFIFLIKKGQDISSLVKNVSLQAMKLINTFWCGPLTLIFEAKEDLPFLAHYKNNKTIALRMPDDELTQTILSNLPYPLPSTSVNLEGEPALNSFNEITQKFENEDFCILSSQANKSLESLNNKCVNSGVSSTIVSLVGNEVKILREGTITKQQILSALQNNN